VSAARLGISAKALRAAGALAGDTLSSLTSTLNNSHLLDFLREELGKQA
jgi:hypothetical protein